MAFLNHIEQMRRVQWGSSHLWDLCFPGYGNTGRPPAPFDKWFPATDVREMIYNVKNMDIQAGISSYSVPLGTDSGDIAITFVDDENQTLLTWMRDWCNDILTTTSKTGKVYPRLKTISEICRIIVIEKLNTYHEVVRTNAYLVYPKDSLYFEGKSTADAVSYQVTFVVAGTIPLDKVDLPVRDDSHPEDEADDSQK